MKRPLALATAAASLVLFGWSSEAAAFCRRTTCAGGDCPVDANGCPSTGKPLIWKDTTLTFRFQALGSALLVNEEARAAVRAAFFRWSDVVCADGRRTSLRFVEGEDLVADKPLTENGDAIQSVSPFGIYFRDHGWPHKERADDGAIALTTLLFGVDSGTLSYADIEINTGDRPLTTTETAQGVDLQTVVTHEVGHYMGLAHSRASNSIMNARLCETGDRCLRDKVAARRLSDDDRSAVCALFPPGVTPPPKGSDDSGGCVASGAAPRTDLRFATIGIVGLALLRRAAHRRARR